MFRNKVLLFVFILCSFTTLNLSANSNSIKFTDAEKKWIQNNPTVTVGCETDWPPFDFTDINGNYTGICADYFRMISNATGLNFSYKFDSWKNLLNNTSKSSKINIEV